MFLGLVGLIGVRATEAAQGPVAPVPPSVITREDSGQVIVRAVRAASPLRIDGRLDEALYADVPAMSDFIQTEPSAGLPATQKTEVWVAFDSEHVYVSFRCWEERPDRIVARELRRDNSNLYNNDIVAFIFDTFYDRRNAFEFDITPIGGRADIQITNERQFHSDWNPVWNFATGLFEGGWTVETAIPFKSLRYRPGTQVWGFNVQRNNRWKNEYSFLTEVPRSRGMAGLAQISQAATLVGIVAPEGSKNLDIKPYAASTLATDARATPRTSNELGREFGVDVKYGPTPNLTADLTYNTDFAQVEADEQQINLTRFSLFFPEKRDFFLENQGIFGFGGGGGDTPLLFHSRRIGLNAGRVVPLDVGGRLSGRVGPFSVGALNVQTGEAGDGDLVQVTPATNFSVVRLKRDILRKSAVGVMYTRRSVDQVAPGVNEAYGVDGAFNFFTTLAVNAYWAQSRAPDRRGHDTSYRVQLDYPADRYGIQLERLMIGDNFNPGVGFVRRDDMLKQYALFRFSPRPAGHKRIRKFIGTGAVTHVENGARRLETRNVEGEFAIEFHNGDRFSLGGVRTYEFLPRPFAIAPGVTLPVAAYDYGTVRAGLNFGQQRPIAGNVMVEQGSFYSGRKTTVTIGRSRVNLTTRFSVEPTFSINRVTLDEGAFTTRLTGSRVTYTMTTRMFASALMQYNSTGRALSANVRFRWEYHPGSELFVVYNEERNAQLTPARELANRALIVKVNRLFRF
jgi:hypothetical protein